MGKSADAWALTIKQAPRRYTFQVRRFLSILLIPVRVAKPGITIGMQIARVLTRQRGVHTHGAMLTHAAVISMFPRMDLTIYQTPHFKESRSSIHMRVAAV